MPIHNRWILLSALLLAALSVVSSLFLSSNLAQAAPPAQGVPEVAVKGSEYAFSGPDQIEAGWVAITFENTGKEPHHANLGRIKDGKTLDDLNAALRANPNAALALVDFVGGPGAVDPTGKQRVVINLTEGTYVFMCFLPAPDGQPHLAKGMIRPLKVVARTSQAVVQVPKADATALLRDFAFTLPSQVKAGPQTWQVTNNGPQPHELGLVKLASGKTVADVQAFLQKPAGPPPFANAGGTGGFANGKSGLVSLDFQPGSYVAICFIPDPASDTPHFALGMIQGFTVPVGTALPRTGGSEPISPIIWIAAIIGAGLIAGGWLIRRRGGAGA